MTIMVLYMGLASWWYQRCTFKRFSVDTSWILDLHDSANDRFLSNMIFYFEDDDSGNDDDDSDDDFGRQDCWTWYDPLPYLSCSIKAKVSSINSRVFPLCYIYLGLWEFLYLGLWEYFSTLKITIISNEKLQSQVL